MRAQLKLSPSIYDTDEKLRPIAGLTAIGFSLVVYSSSVISKVRWGMSHVLQIGKEKRPRGKCPMGDNKRGISRRNCQDPSSINRGMAESTSFILLLV